MASFVDSIMNSNREGLDNANGDLNASMDQGTLLRTLHDEQEAHIKNHRFMTTSVFVVMLLFAIVGVVAVITYFKTDKQKPVRESGTLKVCVILLAILCVGACALLGYGIATRPAMHVTRIHDEMKAQLAAAAAGSK